jgi:hypothetical protein
MKQCDGVCDAIHGLILAFNAQNAAAQKTTPLALLDLIKNISKIA